MPKKMIGIMISKNEEDGGLKIQKAMRLYHEADISFGTFEDEKKFQKIVLKSFKPITKNIFLFSHLPDKGVGRGGGCDEINQLLGMSLPTNLSFTITISFSLFKVSTNIVIRALKTIFKLINPNKTALIKIRDQESEVTLKIPKYLNPSQIDVAIETIKEDADLLHKKVGCHLTFDTESKKFKEE